jgi:DNA-binding PadR family transcriptional regulator
MFGSILILSKVGRPDEDTVQKEIMRVLSESTERCNATMLADRSDIVRDLGGAIYGVLNKMENDGLVTCVMVSEKRPSEHEETRFVYKLTKEGYTEYQKHLAVTET